MTTASPPRNSSDGVSLEDMTRQVYAAIFTDSPKSSLEGEGITLPPPYPPTRARPAAIAPSTPSPPGDLCITSCAQ